MPPSEPDDAEAELAQIIRSTYLHDICDDNAIDLALDLLATVRAEAAAAEREACAAVADGEIAYWVTRSHDGVASAENIANLIRRRGNHQTPGTAARGPDTRSPDAGPGPGEAGTTPRPAEATTPGEIPPPKFKVGDRVRSLTGAGTGTVADVDWSPRGRCWMVGMTRDNGQAESWLAHGAPESKFEPRSDNPSGIEVRDMGLDGKGPWRVFVHGYGVADFPSQISYPNTWKEYADEVARCIGLALKDRRESDRSMLRARVKELEEQAKDAFDEGFAAGQRDMIDGGGP